MLRILYKLQQEDRNSSLFRLSSVYHPVDGEKLPEEKSVLTLGMYGRAVISLELKALWKIDDHYGHRGYEFKPERKNPLSISRTAT